MPEEYTKKIVVRDEDARKMNPYESDDFERASIVPWVASGTGTETVDIITTSPYRGTSHLRLQTDAVTPSIGDFVKATRRFALTPGKFAKIGGLFKTTSSDNHDLIDFILKPYLNPNHFGFRVVENGAYQDYQIRKSDGTYVTIASNLGETIYYVFFELSVDIIKRKYQRLIISDHSYDISEYDAYDDGNNGTAHSISFDIRVETTTAEQSHLLYVDDIYFVIE